MPFLKRIEAFGFKSFADRIKITFPTGVVGIVGPNGSGKSNINDAIRWVLGEQSLKSLRGKNSEDVIFQGSRDRSALNMAEVTLIFDNSKKVFPVDYDEVAITRRVYRGSGSNEYLINKNKVRLKDVQTLVMDTGLSKNSLSIITQGSVANFAQAKPLERRYLFEDAAGVAKYKNRKITTLRKLEHAVDNLTRVSDIISEIEKRLNPLRNQAEKAKKYLAYRKELKKFEVSLIVKDVNYLQENLKVVKNNYNEIETTLGKLSAKVSIQDARDETLRTKSYKYDKQISNLTTELTAIFNEISATNQQRLKISNEQKSNENNLEDRISNLIQNKNNVEAELKTSENSLQQATEKLRKLTEQIARFKTQYQVLMSEQQQTQAKVHYKQIDIEQIKNVIESRSDLPYSVRTILKQKKMFPDLFGRVIDLISYDEKFATTFNVILGRNANNLITGSSRGAKKIVEFLKRNHAGIATFIPLDTIRYKEPPINDQNVASEMDGFIAFATELVDYDQTISSAVKYLFSRIIIAENLDAATNISNLLNARYQLVTIGGDLVRVGGAISGGSRKKNLNNINPTDQLIKAESEYKQLQSHLASSISKNNELNDLIQAKTQELINLEIQIARFKQNILDTSQKLEFVNDELNHLDPTGKLLNNKNDIKSAIFELDTNLHKKTISLREKQIELDTELKTIQSLKESCVDELESVQRELAKIRKEYSQNRDEKEKLNVKQVKLTTGIRQFLDRLVSEYELTFDSASEQYNIELNNEEEVRKTVQELRIKIDDLGRVNVDSIEEFETENTRYTDLINNKKELDTAVSQLNEAIKEMDKTMIERFSATMEAVNENLPVTFKALFGGGSAKLLYTDPNNLLETGIDIIANPPGKKITNINLLSGGEKTLVVLAVLFATIQARPIPLSILDEAEAQLDPVNVEKYANYVKKFSESTQFILVTHRPGTMERCDMLYGVTMQEKGITKILKLQLQNAKKLGKVETKNVS